jgi:MFS family permease
MTDTVPPPTVVPWRLVLLLGALTAFAPMSIDMYLSSLPSIGRTLHTGPEQTQATLAAFFAGMAIGQIIYGPASDRFGRRPPLLVGIVVFFVASVVCALAPNIETLIAARFVQAALFGMRRLMGYAIAGALNGAVLFTYISGAPDLIMGTYGHTPLVFNLIFAFNAVGIIGASQVNRLLLRRNLPDQVLSKASMASIVAAFLLTIAAFTGWGGQWTVLPLLFAALSIYGLMGGNTMAGALSVDPRRAGSISALMGSASFGAGALASWAGGLLHDGSPRPVAGVMFACLVGSALSIFFLALPGAKKLQA